LGDFGVSEGPKVRVEEGRSRVLAGQVAGTTKDMDRTYDGVFAET